MAVKTNCEKNGQKYFRVSLTIGKDVKGRRILKEFYGTTKSSAEMQRDKYREAMENGIDPQIQNKSFGELFKSWIYDVERLRDTLKMSSFALYEADYKLYIAPSPFYPMKLKNVNATIIKKHYNKLYEEEKISTNKIRVINKLMKKFFNYCIKNEWMKSNPANIVDIPGKAEARDNEEVNLQYFTTKEVALMQSDPRKNDTLHMMVSFALGTGLRLGELLALRWSDIQDGYVSVNKTLYQVRNVNADATYEYTNEEYKPKSKTSVRKVPLPKKIINELAAYKKQQNIKFLAAGKPIKPDHYIFTNNNVIPLDGSVTRRSFKYMLKRVGVEEKKFHALRHTYATLLVSNGTPLKFISDLLGHYDIKITQIYSHILPDKMLNVVDCLDQYFA